MVKHATKASGKLLEEEEQNHMAVITIKTEEESRNSTEETAPIKSPTLSEEERANYRRLLDDINRSERLEDELVTKNIRLATATEEPWDLL